MASFDRMATVTASTKRVGAPVDGVDPDPVTNISSLSCLPLDPVSPEVKAEQAALGFKVDLQTMVNSDLDVKENDLLVVGGTEYPIRDVSPWTWRGSVYKALLVEEVRK